LSEKQIIIVIIYIYIYIYIERERERLNRKELLEGGNGIEKEVDPLELGRGWFLRIV
jgi:hypothetical protein